jgi:hypothetical protein
MMHTRFTTLLLIVTLTGPSVGALVCDWTCAAAHGAAAGTESRTESNCHDTPGPAPAATFSVGHACHELPTPLASVVTCAAQAVDVAVTAEHATPETIMGCASLMTRRLDRSHAPPPAHIVPLRI